jgi:hypothetical protein
LSTEYQNGSIVVTGGGYEDRVGVIATGPDADDEYNINEYKIRWAGGKELSGYIPRDELSYASVRQQIDAVAWCTKDAIVWAADSDEGGTYKVGVVIEYNDGEVRLRWAGGTERSNWMKVVGLRRASTQTQKLAVKAWCNTGAIVFSPQDGRVGIVDNDPDNVVEVKLRWAGDHPSQKLSIWMKAARLRPATAAEQMDGDFFVPAPFGSWD